MTLTPASLLELAARTIKLYEIPFEKGDMPVHLESYLDSGHRCVNPKCKGKTLSFIIYSSSNYYNIAGVYFDNRVEHIKFVDFCGKYRIPLLQYLCSSKCIVSKNENVEAGASRYMMRKVLLGWIYNRICITYTSHVLKRKKYLPSDRILICLLIRILIENHIYFYKSFHNSPIASNEFIVFILYPSCNLQKNI